MNKKVNRNISEALAKEQHEKSDDKANRKKLSRSKAKAGRIGAEKRHKK